MHSVVPLADVRAGGSYHRYGGGLVRLWARVGIDRRGIILFTG